MSADEEKNQRRSRLHHKFEQNKILYLKFICLICLHCLQYLFLLQKFGREDQTIQLEEVMVGK